MDIDWSNISLIILEWLSTTGLRIGLIILSVEIISKVLKFAVGRSVRGALKTKSFPTQKDRERREKTLTGILSKAIKIVLWIVAFALILQELGVNLAAVAAGAGVAGLVIGFGAQSFIKDIVSGFFIIFENQYRIGDFVEINTIKGTVEDVTVRLTIVRDIKGNVHHIPNGEILVSTNKTLGFSKVNLDIPVSYASNIDEVEKVMNQVGKDMLKDADLAELIIETPQFFRVIALSDSSVVIKVNGKVLPGAQWKLESEYRRRIKRAFEEHKIEIPFPQVVVHQSKSKKN